MSEHSHADLQDVDWEVKFQFQENYRRENKITGTAFLRALQLPETLLPYLYSNQRKPSIKPSSLGGKLRTSIGNLQMNPPTQLTINSRTDILQEYFIKNEAEFTELGIFAVNIGEEGELKVYSKRDIDLPKVKGLFSDFSLDDVDEDKDVRDLTDLINRLK